MKKYNLGPRGKKDNCEDDDFAISAGQLMQGGGGDFFSMIHNNQEEEVDGEKENDEDEDWNWSVFISPKLRKGSICRIFVLMTSKKLFRFDGLK